MLRARAHPRGGASHATLVLLILLRRGPQPVDIRRPALRTHGLARWGHPPLTPADVTRPIHIVIVHAFARFLGRVSRT